MITNFAQRWSEIEPLIDQLFEVPSAERPAWLSSHCVDPTLRELVMQALGNAPAIEVLEGGMAQWLPQLAENPSDKLPAISGYRVLRFVGAGGMASVFEAERELPGGPQIVALKLLRIDVHDADERRRFLREQHILARLQHPHIAQLLDAGFSPAGTPFLALEFVAGVDLITHCEQRALALRERLALFIDVSAAVEHAHRSLIVHRDLKPSNVLVGADGCVKLVDFGIAKLLTGEGEQTRTEVRRLTRSYAAPEQYVGDVATTAIDVYALGVLLAELLCGRQHRADKHIDTKYMAFDDGTLRQKLGVDFHAIVRKATQPDPLRRYTSVAALREDIERYLHGRPLQARPDTFAYRVFTLIKRHALAVSVGAVIAVILAGATSVGLYEARLARHSAQEARAQTNTAEGEAKRADALKSFLEGLFDGGSDGAPANETTAELLAHGRERANRDFAMQPALRVEILALVGDLERRSGRPDSAQQPLEEAAALAKLQFGATDRRTLHVEYLLAKEADDLGRVRDAKLRLQNAITAFESGPNRGSPEEVVALAWLAGLDERIGDSAKAIDLGSEALALARRAVPQDNDALTEAVTNLGWIQMDAGHPGDAEPLLREALVRKRNSLGSRHPDIADTMAYLTSTLTDLGRYGEGEQLMRDALDIDAGAYVHPNAHTAWHLNDLATVLTLEGKLSEASAFYAKAIVIYRALAPTATLNHAITLGNLARIQFRQGAYAESEAGLRDVMERKQHLLGADYGDNGRSFDQDFLAEILVARGRFDEARKLADSALADAQQRHREAHPDVAFALTVEAELMAATGAYEHAASFADRAVLMYAELADQGSQRAIRARLLSGDVQLVLGHNSEARLQFEGALADADRSAPKIVTLVAHAEADLARVDATMGDYAAANLRRAEADAALAEIEQGPNTERDTALRLLANVRIRSR